MRRQAGLARADALSELRTNAKEQQTLAGGPFDSSLTRVAPVFDRLRTRSDDWVRTLLRLVKPATTTPDELAALDLRFLDGHWGSSERGLPPPASLLSWLIRNPTPQLIAQDRLPERSLLASGDPETVERALRELRSSTAPKGWHVLEGPTYPDALLETPDALVVIEGKRTESGPTVDTTWLTGRHQIWRHLDAAWEIRGRRRVFGFFLVQGTPPGGDVPPVWQQAFTDALEPSSLASSFPHRSATECKAIASCFLGGTTWQRVCSALGIEFADLPDRVSPPTIPSE